MKNYAIGADIGGSHISAVAVDLENKKILLESYTKCDLDNKAPAEQILDCWSKTLNKTIAWVDKPKLAGVGFAMPGPFEYDRGIAKFTHEVDKYENLYNVDVGLELKKRLELSDDTHLRFMNDATSFAVGESWIGNAVNYSRTIAITLGTGFGSAFIHSGIPVLERDDVPALGCFWHLPYKEGIADDYFSTRWFLKRYEELTGERLPGVKEIAELAKSDNNTKKLFVEFGTNLGEFIAPWLMKFEAECIVLGGNLTKSWELFDEAFLSMVEKSGIKVYVKLSELGETAAMIGSALLMENNFWLNVKPLLPKM